jgi:hypothetical protein
MEPNEAKKEKWQGRKEGVKVMEKHKSGCKQSLTKQGRKKEGKKEKRKKKKEWN